MRNVINRVSDALEFIGTASKSTLIGIGQWITTIVSAELTKASANADWKDRTAQLAVVFQAEDGKKITKWYNLNGFARRSDLTMDMIKGVTGAMVGLTNVAFNKLSPAEKIDACFDFVATNGKEPDGSVTEYAVSKVTIGNLIEGHRVVDATRTTDARKLIGQIWVDAGNPVGTKFNETDLVGLTVGIVVQENSTGGVQVAWTKDPARVA